jgi:hypothetical protein
MLSFVGSSLLLGVDTACACAAIRIHIREDGVKWQLPIAFAFCDGLSSFLGSVVRVGQGVDRSVAPAATLAAYVVATGMLLIIAKWPGEEQWSWLRRAITLIAVPLLLGTDNFFAGKALLASFAPATLAVMTGAISYVMSLLGLMLGSMIHARLRRFAWGVLASVVLLAIARMVA